MKIILGSSSPSRKQILKKLRLPFICQSPDIDETVLDGESPGSLVLRLAKLKALEVGKNNPQALVIASDQVAVLDNSIMGKPITHENAVKQLRSFSSKKVVFYNGLCLLNSVTQNIQSTVETFNVFFRKLSDEEIDNYLKVETPYNCAGSFKSEGLGIALLEKLEGDDPNTLIGLPLIKLTNMLANENVNPLTIENETKPTTHR